MNKKMSKRRRDIKSKLMAAICMLLVSSIMMVSTTYAWFTLSTAPEVTGINTAVGANGNLEMALLPTDGLTSSITSEAGDSILDPVLKNVTWGNLVDLSSNAYGLDKITLFPSALNAATSDEAGNPATLATALLQTPTYGADGRVSELVANTFTGYYDSVVGSFSPNSDMGVRAVGTASGMTDRQLSYRNARSNANTAKAQAANQAAQSLNSNGSALANIAIKYGMNSDSAKFNATDVKALRTIVDDLQGTETTVGVLDQIEKAYMQYILASAASAKSDEGDVDGDLVWSAVKTLVEEDGATLVSVKAGLSTAGMTLPTALTNAIDKYEATVEAVASADEKLAALETTLQSNPNAEFTWTDIRDAMATLANPAKMKINGILASEVKSKLGELVSSVTKNNGLTVIMESGAGVYADIADHCGDYTASITIERVEYNGIELENMDARMETDSDQAPNYYLVAIGGVVEGLGAPASGEAGSMPITDMYGFVVDLAFRTNATNSNLLLQVEAADRIYSDNSNEQTMGHGSSMTFKSTTTDFTTDQVKTLMSAIRIVFFEPGTDNKVVATAKLDTANATIGADGITAKMYLYKNTAGGTTTEYVAATHVVDDEQAGTYKEAATGATHALIDGVYVAATHVVDTANEGQYKLPEDGEIATHAVKTTTTTAGENKIEDNKIMALTQNQAQALSVLVYLDGSKVTNGSVAATDATSMTGTMNLQFASSATLVPMEYTALHTPGADSGTDSGSSDAGNTDAGTDTPADGGEG